MKSILFALVFLFITSTVYGFQKNGCGSGNCIDCHTLTRQEAAGILKGRIDKVLKVKLSEVPGLWSIEAVYKGKEIPLYLDFSKKYLFSGNVIRLKDWENIARADEQPPERSVDVSSIPLDDAVILGNPIASERIIVFDDPECPFCRKLQPEMLKIVREHKNIAFYIKMFPLQSHPGSYERAKTIICTKSDELLTESLNGQPIPPPLCETDQVEKNKELGKKLHIDSTPTLIFPNGKVHVGYIPADTILSLLKKNR
jgi:thiol:disulfide interchange protein DsbC